MIGARTKRPQAAKVLGSSMTPRGPRCPPDPALDQTRPAPVPRRTARSPSKTQFPVRKAEKPEIRIFVSYSHVDEPARVKLETHLAALKRDNVSTWFDGAMDAGAALDTDIARALRRAQVFVALFSPEYLASRYCWNVEYGRAMNRRARGTMRVVAVVVRPCDWKETRAARFKLLPRDGRAVTRWRSADEAFLDVAAGIRGVVKAVRREMTEAPATTPGRKRAPTAATPGGAAKRALGRGVNGDKGSTRPERKRGHANGPARKAPASMPKR